MEQAEIEESSPNTKKRINKRQFTRSLYNKKTIHVDPLFQF